MLVEEVVGDVARWLFTADGLQQARLTAHARAVQGLACLSASATREPPKQPLKLSEELRIVFHYASQIPVLCRQCDAGSEVWWTAIVFYRRFFAIRSPMEFDPLAVMLACIHVACKIEEMHSITLEMLMAVTPGGDDEALQAKVIGLELPVLEAIGFQLLVEPKPDTALRAVSQELQQLLVNGTVPQIGFLQQSADVDWAKVVEEAERIVVDLSTQTDAVLLWPTSVLVLAAACAALEGYVGHASESSASLPPAALIVQSFWDAHLNSSGHGSSRLRELVGSVAHEIAALSPTPDGGDDIVGEIKKNARRCHRAFERMRDEASQRHEANRQERKKRRWSEKRHRSSDAASLALFNHHFASGGNGMLNFLEGTPVGTKDAGLLGIPASIDGEESFLRRLPMED